jgi:hypothetical protein
MKNIGLIFNPKVHRIMESPLSINKFKNRSWFVVQGKQGAIRSLHFLSKPLANIKKQDYEIEVHDNNISN